jgi:hypothetical protein
MTGKPGSGKSHVLADAASRSHASGMTLGVLRLDVALPAQTASELGSQAAIGFGGAPARILARASGGKPSVLVIDQVDSASQLSGRGPAIFPALRDMLDDARATAGMKVLVACRSEDLRFDMNLRRLVRLDTPSPTDATPIELGDLSVDQVREALATLNLDTTHVPPALLRLTSNVLNLALFAQVYESSDPLARPKLTAIRTRLQLLGEYHLLISRRTQAQLGPNGYASAALRIAREMSDSGTQSVGRGFMMTEPTTLDTLLHEGTLVEANGRIRFFHEAMFDYLAALALRTGGVTATQLLATPPQELLRRGQVRAMLALARDEGGRVAYITDLAGVLDRTKSRSHIRVAVLSMLNEVDDAWDEELALVLATAADSTDPMHGRARVTLASEPMARLLASAGLIDVMAEVVRGEQPASANPHTPLLTQIGAEGCFDLLIRMAANQPDAAAATACAVVSADDRVTMWLYGFFRLVHIAGASATGPALSDLFIELTAAATSAALGQERYRSDVEAAAQRDGISPAAVRRNIAGNVSREGRHAIAAIAKATPAEGARVLQAWLNAQVLLHAAAGKASLFDRAGASGQHQLNSNAVDRIAEAEPLTFVKAILPIAVDAWNAAALDARWTPTGDRSQAVGLRHTRLVLAPATGSIEHVLTGALVKATAIAIESDPGPASALLASLHSSDLLPIHQFLGGVYEKVTIGPLLDAAYDWAIDPRVRGLSHT